MQRFDRSDDDTPLTLVGVEFSDQFRAQEFLTAATRLAANGDLRLRDAVFVAAAGDGKTVVRETIDPSPGRSALGGAMWTGLFGLLLEGPIGWIGGMAIGAGTGAVTAKVIDLGIPDEWVEWFRNAVGPNRVILALLVSDVDVNVLVEEAGRFAGAELVYANLDPTALARLHAALGSPDDTDGVGDGDGGDDTEAPVTLDGDGGFPPPPPAIT
jgi:uncharacterized membrane protein